MFKTYSDKTAQLIDEKIKKYTTDCYEQSKKLIIQNKSLIEKLSVVLLDKEYLAKEEFESMITDFSKTKKTIKKM
jgi:cell division protease FtsH